MLKVDNKKEQIEIVGDSNLLKDEIGTLMLALCGEIANVSKGAAEDMFNHIVKSVACVAAYLETKCGVRLKDFHDQKEKEEALDEEIVKALKELQEAINYASKRNKKGNE